MGRLGKTVGLSLVFLFGVLGCCSKAPSEDSNDGGDSSTEGSNDGGDGSTYTFSGEILGGGASDVSVTIDCGGATLATTTDAGGSFSFEGLISCQYTVTLQKEGCTFLLPGTSDSAQEFLIEISADTSQDFYINCNLNGHEYALGWGGAGSNLFNNLASVVVDGDGNIWTADYQEASCRIRKWDASGSLLLDWIGNDIDGATGLDVDASGFAYATSFNTNGVLKYSSGGDLVTGWTIQGSGTFSGQEKGIALSSDGSVYISDGGNDRIQKFTSSGSFVTEWGTSGTGEGQLDNPVDLDVDSEGNIYVLDAGNSRVQKFDANGNFILSFGSSGETTGQFDTPRGIGIDAYDNIYVADEANYRIQIFFSDGTFAMSFGNTNSGGPGSQEPGEFNLLSDVAVDASGNIYTVESTPEGRVQKFIP